jgi:hypothetical protein
MGWSDDRAGGILRSAYCISLHALVAPINQPKVLVAVLDM